MIWLEGDPNILGIKLNKSGILPVNTIKTDESYK